jgi:hypothetical protein
MSETLKWMLVLCGIVAFGVIGFTALDRYDEQTCRQIPTAKVTVRRNPVYEPTDWATGPPAFVRRVAETCDGFLPW